MTLAPVDVRSALLGDAKALNEEAGGLPVNLKLVCNRLGIEVRRQLLSKSEGIVLQRNGGWRVVLPKRGSDSVPALLGRDRFTLAHEIGHIRLSSLFKESIASVPAKVQERLCDEFAAELLLPTEHVRQFLVASRRRSESRIPRATWIRQLAALSQTSIEASARAVSRGDSSVLVAGLHTGPGQPDSPQARLEALRVRWSTRSELCNSGLRRFKRIAKDHQLFRIYERRTAFLGKVVLDLPPLAFGAYEVDFSPYKWSGDGFYLLIINLSGVLSTPS